GDMKSCTHAGPRARTARYWLAAAALAAAGGAQAVSFQLFDGVDATFDTTVGYGIQLRTEKYDRDLSQTWPYGSAAAELQNNQFGNRTLFDDKWDVFSNVVKASHDLQINGNRWNAFVRGNYFYDFAMLGKDDQLPQASENRAIKHGDITDAYVLKRLGSADQFTIRLGKQVISWGENTFIGGSINDINTIDITKIRQPGVELKDALVGTPAAYASWQMSEAFTLEAFTLFAYDELKVDPYGGFFGTLDIITDGAGYANGMAGPFPVCTAPDGGTCHFNAPGGVPVTRAADNLPKGSQYGVAMRYYAPNLGNGFDFGLYYQKLHDHNPQVSAIAGRVAGAGTPPPIPGSFFVDYAKGVERYGASFNTTVGPWALGGEYSYRRNAPIQGLGAFLVGAYGNVGTAPFPVPTLPAGTVYEGFERYKRHQIQMTTQRLWGPMPMLLGADQWNTIGEVAYGWVDDVPGIDVNGHEKTPFGPATVPAVIAAATAGGGFVRFDDITNSFWGFQARSTLTYNNILFNRINMDFNTAFRWDVEGVSPELGGAQLFVGGRKQASIGVTFDYALRWKLGISQTFIFDGEDDQFRPLTRGRNVSGTDRDFLSMDVSYTF
ncbi:MAG: DUF1302 domain-containing protein, partial [Immundisolibacter sp.]|uniref:DUF1302 domain-containing protein n=1 Tax=Immundisolibacter sp. TaxID=1934948 RepID=UPI003EE3FE56